MVLICMGKFRVAVALIATVFMFSLILNLNVVSQAANTSVTVLSYSGYVAPSGDFVVLGEVQNTGNHALESVSLNVLVNDAAGTQIAAGTTNVLVKEFLPQQKAPFYLDFGKIDLNLFSSKVAIYNISLSNAPPTNYLQYPDLALNVDFNGIANDVYVVSGSITNNGNQIANDIKIEGTYYNTAGNVVAVGFILLNDPLAPNTSENFTVGEFDAAPSLVTKISDFSLLVQTSTQIFSLPASSSPSVSPQPLDSSVWTFGIVGVVSIVAVALVAFVFLRKHRSRNKG
jgi:hypothetical protein